MGPSRGRAFYCLFATIGEDFGEEQLRLWDFLVGLDEGRSLGQVSTMYQIVSQSEATVAQNAAAGREC